MPLALIPFLILIFHVLGGGGSSQTIDNIGIDEQKGANYMLPEAESSIEILDKLEAYENQESKVLVSTEAILGEEDSLLFQENKELIQKDAVETDLLLMAKNNRDVSNSLLAHIKRKETEIRAGINDEMPNKTKRVSKEGIRKTSGKKNNSVKPLIKKSGLGEQPESMIRTTGIGELDKVFDENNQLNQENDSLKFYLNQAQQKLSVMEKSQKQSFSLEKQQTSAFEKEDKQEALIKAEVYETTTVLDGNRVKLRLLEDVWVNNIKIGKNAFIYGICQVKNERLHISITQLPLKDNFLPVDLAIYDIDGLPGLYVPDNVARQVYKEVGPSTNTSSLFGMTDDPLTYAGIRAADRTTQALLKRQRLKKVCVRKNTLVYIINQKS